jgi:translation initiation factor RLI1
MGNYFMRMYQGEYLAGYMAGLMGHKNVGTVATQPIPEPVRGINAFTIGLRKGLKEADVAYDPAKLNTVVWLKSWRDATNETLLAVQMKGIVKSFPGVVANNGIDFQILPGEIHTLLGENGAGKTILMNIVSGNLKEVLSLSDRILVLFRGTVMDIIPCEDERLIERVGPLMAGLKGRA